MFGGAYGDARMPNWPHWHRTPLPGIITTGLRRDPGEPYMVKDNNTLYEYDTVRYVGQVPTRYTACHVGRHITHIASFKYKHFLW